MRVRVRVRVAAWAGWQWAPQPFGAMSETMVEHLRKFDAACQSATDTATRQAAEAYLLDFRSKPFAQEVALKVRHLMGLSH